VIDIVDIDTGSYLQSISSPVGYFMSSFLGEGSASKTHPNLLKAITKQIMAYRGEGFVITEVISDNELISLESSINSMEAKLSVGGPKSNAVAKLDRHIRLLKERMRDPSSVDSPFCYQASS
jgi:hypothetical protein